MLRKITFVLGSLAFFGTGLSVIFLPGDVGQILARVLIVVSLLCGGTSLSSISPNQKVENERNVRSATAWGIVSIVGGALLMWLVFAGRSDWPYRTIGVIAAMLISSGGFIASHLFASRSRSDASSVARSPLRPR